MKIFSVIMVCLFFRKNKMCTWVNEKIWVMMKTCFHDIKQIQKFSKTTLCKEGLYVKKDRNESDENFDSPPDNKPTFLSS